MRDFSPIWEEILKSILLSGYSKKEAVAKAIGDAIKDGRLPLGSPLHTTRDIAEYLGIGKGCIEGAWEILKRNKLIVTCRGGGTYVVNKLPTSKKMAAQTLDIPVFKSRPALFDQEFVPATDKTMDGFQTKFLKKCNNHLLQAKVEELSVSTELIQRLLLKINGYLCTTYTVEELYYLQSLKHFIYKCWQKLGSSKGVFVMVDTAPLEVQHSAAEAGAKVRMMETGSSGIKIEKLEEFLRTSTVNIVFIMSRCVVPVAQQMRRIDIERLFMLQKQYKFYIIDYDQYANFYETKQHILMHMAFHQQLNVIYIRHASRLYAALMELIVVVAQAKIIKVIRDSFMLTGKSLNMAYASSLNELMADGTMLSFESKLKNRSLPKVIKLTREVLSASGFWEKEGIFENEGWIFYLVPKTGVLPVDTRTLLLKDNIHVVDLKKFGFTQTKNIIIISVVGHMDLDHLVEDLNKLTDAAKGLTKFRKNEKLK